MVKSDEQTKIKFKIKVFGMSVNGNFSEIKINTNVNYGDLSRSYTD